MCFVFIILMVTRAKSNLPALSLNKIPVKHNFSIGEKFLYDVLGK